MSTSADRGSPQPPDRGLQRERTALSWNRTALSLVVVALLLVRSGFIASQPLLTVLGALLLVGAAAIVLFAARRSYAGAAPHQGFALIAAVGTLACAAGLVSILV